MNYELEDMVAKIDRLPAPNVIALEVIQLTSDPEVSNNKLVRVISKDQSLTSQILKIANSSYFNFPRTIYSLDRAIVILGLNLLKDVALSIAFYSFYKDLKNGDNFDFQHLWRHSLMTALVGKALAKKYDPDHQDLFYIGGLLHDIGKLVESIVIAKDYQLLQKKSREEGLRLDQVERRNLKFHHGDVGGLLVEKWNLPEILVNMIRYHHYPDEFIGEPTYYRQIRFVYLSNILTHYIQDEFEGLEAILNFDLNFSNYFSFSGDEFEELITEIKEDMEKKQQLFKIN